MNLPNKKRGIRLVARQRTRLSFKQIAFVSTAFCFLLVSGLFIYFNFSNPQKAYAAVAGEYRSKTSGYWSSITTWERFNGMAWGTPALPPGVNDSTITILNTHIVTINSSISANQVVINSGGQLVLNSTITLTLTNGTGTDLNVSGIFKNSGTVTISPSATIAFQSTGKYQHSFSSLAGAIPVATWSAGSTCEIIDVGSSSGPTGMTQSFSNFTWNCASQSGDVTLSGTPSTVTGNYTITSTGSKELRLASASSTLNIGGNFLQSAGKLSLNTSDNSTTTINITGNFSVNGGTFSFGKVKNAFCNLNVTGNWSHSSGTIVREETNCNNTITINGNWSQTGGTYSMDKDQDTTIFTVYGLWSQTGGSYSINGKDGLSTFNLYSNYTHTGATLAENNSGSNIKFFFKKTGNQIYTASSNTVTGDVDYTINSGAVLVMDNNIMKGRNFTLSSGGGIQLGSALGITSTGTTGNIQVTGTRSYSTGANYTYNGTVAQVTGNGLPATVNNFTLNNGNTLSLTATVSVSNVLALTSGKIVTGTNEVKVTNSAPAAITGYSSNNYVAGLLRRRITGTGTYDFPVGSSGLSELITVTLSSATGFSNILGSFTNSAPITAQSPLTGVQVNGLTIETMLNYGYWTLTPDTAMASGTYNVTLQEKGYTPPNAGRSYCVLKRTNNTSPWQSVGTHDLNTQSEVSGVVTALRSNLNSFSDFGIGYGEYLQLKYPVLYSGTAGQPNAIYIFSDVCTNVDMWVQILELVDGATLDDIDHYTAGYDEAWQPFVSATPGDTSSIRWLLKFKVADTSIDTIMPNISITAVDVDGDGAYLKEMVEADHVYSYGLDPSTALTVTGNGGTYRAISTIGNVANIDTAAHPYIFQINYKNVSSFTYRTGAISTYWDREVRQNCLYFKFLLPGGSSPLPVKLVSFSGKPESENSIEVEWKTAAEINNHYFTLFRSPDGKKFTEITKVNGAGSSTSLHRYSFEDLQPFSGKTYYKLMQTDYNGKTETFEIISVTLSDKNKLIADMRVFPNPFNNSFSAEFEASAKEEVQVTLLSVSGVLVYNEKIIAEEGKNFYRFTAPANLKEGTYIIRITGTTTVLGSSKIIYRKN